MTPGGWTAQAEKSFGSTCVLVIHYSKGRGEIGQFFGADANPKNILKKVMISGS
jgi:hypothetical protein